MLPDFIRHSITLQVEIIAMVSEEIQQRAESYVQSNSSPAYEAFLNDMINNIEKTVDLVSAPVEQLMQQTRQLTPESTNPLVTNWNDALDTLNERMQQVKDNLRA